MSKILILGEKIYILKVVSCDREDKNQMKVNIYYGGRGLLDDPTLYVLGKMEEVLRELRVTVERVNIYEHKNEIATLPQTMKEADGIILATTVEWLGIGGYMQQFLDACWLYGDKEKIKTTYMQPIVMSTTYGEREGEVTLANAWEILGGLPCPGLCGYVENLPDFEANKDFTVIIEKKAENLYRTISQKLKSLPTSNQAVKQSILRTPQMELTPQESEQLSKYVSDDTYVKKQKEDIEELASMFKDMLGKSEKEDDSAYIMDFQSRFMPQTDFHARYLFILEGKKKPLFLEVNNDKLELHYGQEEGIDVYAKMTPDIMESIIQGRMTFQRAFMTGEMTAKGNFKVLRMLDSMFNFA
jgi:multimeric flavodoxin WrbA